MVLATRTWVSIATVKLPPDLVTVLRDIRMLEAVMVCLMSNQVLINLVSFFSKFIVILLLIIVIFIIIILILFIIAIISFLIIIYLQFSSLSTSTSFTFIVKSFLII